MNEVGGSGRSVVPGGLRELASSNEQKASTEAPRTSRQVNRNDADGSGDPAKRALPLSPEALQDKEMRG